MADYMNWAELPWDVISLIFLKLGTIEVLLRAQAVCRSWWQVAHKPQVWHCIDMRCKPPGIVKNALREKLAPEAVDRCGGYLEDLYVYNLHSGEFLSYVADRTTRLRCLVLIETGSIRLIGTIKVEGLSAFVGRCPLLEELQINMYHPFFEQTFEGVIRMLRGKLKRLRLKKIWHVFTDVEYDIEALEIANHMPQLCELQLIGNKITNKGLHAILDKCLFLGSLHIRACFNVNVDAGLQAKLSKLKMVRLPGDHTFDYKFSRL